jgi:hypothetical protein
MMTKLDKTIDRLEQWLERFERPVVMSSFGKDSMTMLFIIFKLMEKKMPVVYHAMPWAPWKNDWAQNVIKSWRLEVYDYLPIASGIKVKPDRLEIVNRYQPGFDAPVNILPPKKHWTCGLKMLLRPKGTIEYPWNLTLIGHKSSDVDQFEGHMPLKSDLVEMDGMPALGFPLKDWNDVDLWTFIEERRIPFQSGTRYICREEIEFKDFNNDFIEACTACIDPRNPEKVFCPLVNREVDNVSARITKFEGRPSYIGGEE